MISSMSLLLGDTVTWVPIVAISCVLECLLALPSLFLESLLSGLSYLWLIWASACYIYSKESIFVVSLCYAPVLMFKFVMGWDKPLAARLVVSQNFLSKLNLWDSLALRLAWAWRLTSPTSRPSTKNTLEMRSVQLLELLRVILWRAITAGYSFFACAVILT